MEDTLSSSTLQRLYLDQKEGKNKHEELTSPNMQTETKTDKEITSMSRYSIKSRDHRQ